MSDHFEDALEQTLADLAKVDRATVLDPRDVIAGLPDRRWTRVFRLRRSISGLLVPRWRPEFTVVGAAVLIAAVVAVSIFGHLQGRPVVSNSEPATASLPVGGSATPSATPRATPKPSPTIRTGSAFDEMLPVILTGRSVAFGGWSPDGSRYAVGEAIGDASYVAHLFDRSGREVDSFEAEDFAWLSTDSFVVIRNDGYAYMGRVGSTDFTKLGRFDWLVAGRAGSVALTDWPDGATPSQTYVVVSADGSLSKPRNGEPEAWSRDGSMLAVWHPTALAPAPSGVQPATLGWLEVVRSTGVSVVSVSQIKMAEPQVAFSPDGARLAFTDDPQSADSSVRIGVLEIPSGRVSLIPQSGPFAWATSDELLFAYTSVDYGVTPAGIYSWWADTGQLAMYGPGDTVGASGQGAVVIGSDTTHIFTFTQPTANKLWVVTFSVGASMGPDAIHDSAWSPDGSALILVAGDWNNGPMDALLFQP
jgi:hypothetical protein